MYVAHGRWDTRQGTRDTGYGSQETDPGRGVTRNTNPELGQKPGHLLPADRGNKTAIEDQGQPSVDPSDN